MTSISRKHGDEDRKVQVAANDNSLPQERINVRALRRCSLRQTNAKPKVEALQGLICMVDVEPEQVQWMWRPYIPFAKCTAVDGDPGQGKSFLTTKIAACMS